MPTRAQTAARHVLRAAVAALLVMAVVGAVAWFLFSYLNNGSDCGPSSC